MDPYMEKDERRQMKKDKAHYNMLEYIADGQYGVPTSCPCGDTIVDEVAALNVYRFEPGRRYFTFKHYKDDGLHFRQPWVKGVQEELSKLNRRGDEAEKQTWHVYDLLREDLRKMREVMAELQTEVAELKMEVANLQRVI